MFDVLFQHRSPLVGWFILMELLTAACIIGFWVRFFGGNLPPWEHGESGPMVMVTGLFVVSNALLLRYRGWAVSGFIICWLLMALTLLPTL